VISPKSKGTAVEPESVRERRLIKEVLETYLAVNTQEWIFVRWPVA